MKIRKALILPVGPGQIANVLDTIESILFYTDDNISLFVIDDCTTDGTYDELLKLRDDRIVLMRNSKSFGYMGLHVTVAAALRECVRRGPYDVIMRIDWDALMTGPGIMEEAATFLQQNPHVGALGRHMINYDGTSKSYAMHTKRMREITGFPPRRDRWRGGIGWICRLALANGWGLGENIFGGAFFLRYECAEKMIAMGFFDRIENPKHWVIEDVFFTMCVLASGYDRAHFAAPTAPLALAWRGLPAPARELHDRGMKVLHSVDKGPFTSEQENDGVTPREYFKRIRKMEQL